MDRKKFVDEFALDFDYNTGSYGGKGGGFSSFPATRYGFTSTGYRSPSSWVQSKFRDGWDRLVVSGESKETRLRKALHTLGRTVNIVENSAGGGERSLSLVWATDSGECLNSPMKNSIVLNPTMISQGDEKNDQFAIDYFTGQALLLSSMKRTMSVEAYQQFDHAIAKEQVIEKTLWKAQELIKAKSSVVKDWAGFGPYFDVYEQKTTLDLHESMIEYAQQPMTANVFANIVAWNSLCPNHQISVDESYAWLMDEILDRMTGTVSKYDQFNHATRLANRIREVLPVLEEETPPSGGSGDDSSDEKNPSSGASAGDKGGEGSDRDDSSSDESNPSSRASGSSSVSDGPTAGGDVPGAKPVPQFIDSTLFGEQAVGKDEETTIRQPSLDLGDDSLKANNPLNHTDYEQETARSTRWGYSDLSLSSIGACRLIAKESFVAKEYKEKVASLRQEITAIRRVLAFRSTKATRFNHGKEEGELDEGSFHKLAANSPFVWSQKTVMTRADVAICILVDESGSMCNDGRIFKVKDTVIALTESLKDLKGVNLTVIGHSGMTSDNYSPGMTVQPLSNSTKLPMREFSMLSMREFYGKYHNNPYAIMGIKAIAENLDGYAIEYATKRLKTDYPHAKQHILIHLSDGVPCPTTVAHTRRSVDKCIQRLGVEVFAIGVDKAYTKEQGEALYGKGRNVVINDVMGSLSVLRPFLKQVLS